MIDYKTEYKKTLEEYSEGEKRIKELEENDVIKEYLKLRENKRNLQLQLNLLREKVKKKEYAECNHIWIQVSDDGRGHEYCGCIKCGLDERVRHENNLCALSDEEILMKNFMRFNYYRKGYISNVSCNLQLAMAIYKKIKEKYHDIDDITALKYFEIALDNIRDIKVNSKRKRSRAIRLDLNPNFDNWGK